MIYLEKQKIHKKWKGENTMKAVNVHRLWKAGFYGSSIILSSCCSGIGERGEDAGKPHYAEFQRGYSGGRLRGVHRCIGRGWKLLRGKRRFCQ